MPALILYLLKVNVALVLFYLAYHFVLRWLTFYALNRCFLLFGIVFSTAYPFIDVSGLMSRHQDLASVYINSVPVWVTAPAIQEQTPAFDYWQIPVFLFWLGTGVMAIRLLLQFISLYKIHAASEPTGYKGICFRQANHITQAFSFWQTIYLNPAQQKEAELESILRHEQVHVKGWHTLDVLLAELNTVFYWFNPGAWLMKKAIKENLEFIADQKVVSAGVDRKAYQYLLLKVVGAPEPQIANQFNFPSLKRRIAMMNKIPTKKANQLRLLIALPLVAVLLLAFRGTAQTQSSEQPQDPNMEIKVTENIMDKSKEYMEAAPNVFIKNNLDLEYVSWRRPGTLVVKPINEKADTFQLDDEQDLAEANRKYGLRLTPSDKKNEAPSGGTLQAPAKDILGTQKHSEKKTSGSWYRGEIYIRSESGDLEAYIRGRDAEPTAAEKQPASAQSPNSSRDYETFLKRNPAVSDISWKSGKQVVIKLKSGKEEVYQLDDTQSVAAAERKYGKLPYSPPVINQDAAAKEASQQGAAQRDQREKLKIGKAVNYKDAANLPDDYKAFLKRNPTVKHISWKFNNQQDGVESVVIYLKSGGSEVYDFNDKKSMATVERKYGELPTLPPPPPPYKSDIPIYIPDASNIHEDHSAFLKRNPEVKQLGWMIGDSFGREVRMFVVYLKSGETETYDLDHGYSVDIAENKYGELPALPPPPPPVKHDDK